MIKEHYIILNKDTNKLITIEKTEETLIFGSKYTAEIYVRDCGINGLILTLNMEVGQSYSIGEKIEYFTPIGMRVGTISNIRIKPKDEDFYEVNILYTNCVKHDEEVIFVMDSGWCNLSEVIEKIK